MRVRIHPAAAAVTVSLVLIAGCSGDISSGGSDTTTAAATTTEAATTTVAAPADFTLRSDGLGPFDFGTPADEVIDALTAEFGAPTELGPFEFIEDPSTPGGPFIEVSSLEGEGVYFAYRAYRALCWYGITFCGTFGGDSQDALSFVGWDYSDDATAMFKTAGGVSVGTRWSDAPEMTDFSGFCEVGEAVIHGIYLRLLSHGERFDSSVAPNPEDVFITDMETGQLIDFSQKLCP